MKRKSIISAILILFVFAVFMAGCNNTANTGTKTTTTPTPVATATDQDSEPSTSGSDTTVKLPIVNEPFKVTIWAPNGEGIQKTMKTLSDPSITRIRKENRSNRRIYSSSDRQQNDSFNLMVSSGNYPIL